MMCFERLLLSHLTPITDPLLDLLQFVYRSVDEAVHLTRRFTLEHLDTAAACARILSVDFNSAVQT